MGRKSVIHKILFMGMIIVATMMLNETVKHTTVHKSASRNLRKLSIKPYKHYQHANILNAAAEAANKYLHIDGDK